MDGSKLPANFSAPEAWPEYAYFAGISDAFSIEEVGTMPRGVRRAAWPTCVEEYFGDAEPDLKISRRGKLARNRIIYWNRITRTDVPPGWHSKERPWRTDGYALLGADYKTSWSRNAHRNVQIWRQHAKNYDIRVVSLDFFAAAYMQGTVAQKVGMYYLDLLKRRWKDFPQKPELWLVIGTDGKAVAGAAVHFFSNRKASVWECPFTTVEGQAVHASSGLVEYWFDESQRRGMDILLNTYFWQPGDPPEWKGLSEFKLRYGFVPHTYPAVLWRFARGRLF